VTSTCAPRTRRSLACALATAALLALGAGAAEDPATALLDRVQKRYDGIRDVRARFQQTSRVAALGREDESRGAVVIARPGRMRWEYETPEPSVLVIDGEAVRLYSPGDRKLQIAPLGGASLSPTALGFLLGAGVLANTFRAESLPPSPSAEIGLKLWPREESSFESLEMWFDPSTLVLRESVLLDLFGNKTRVRFSEVAENVGAPEQSFALDVPEGTEVIDLR
jgi:outer membrane lipoprotein-sorting protein